MTSKILRVPGNRYAAVLLMLFHAFTLQSRLGNNVNKTIFFWQDSTSESALSEESKNLYKI